MSLRPDITVEVLNARVTGRLPGLMGFRVMALEQGLLVAELDIRPELLAPNGFLHAATVITLADTACGFGCIAHLPKGAENFTTVELKTNFLGTAREGTIACVAHPSISATHAGLGRDGHAPRRRPHARALPLHADGPLAEGEIGCSRRAASTTSCSPAATSKPRCASTPRCSGCAR
jgi:uncharacterized protein (TIGR00369 family)